MPRPSSLWESISLGLSAATALLASLAVGAGLGWLVGHTYAQVRFVSLFIGLLIGLMIGVWLTLRLLNQSEERN